MVVPRFLLSQEAAGVVLLPLLMAPKLELFCSSFIIAAKHLMVVESLRILREVVWWKSPQPSQALSPASGFQASGSLPQLSFPLPPPHGVSVGLTKGR